ncbi:MAG: hypothetical protein H6828_12850 [Planctomycetes bacterium]|nr:hypothetical protein [Planctomycetota bacterium]
MDSTQIPSRRGDLELAVEPTGLQRFTRELLAAERGEEPVLDRLLQALDLVESDARRAADDDPERARLRAGLRGFLLDLREDDVDLAVEDVDLLLEVAQRLGWAEGAQRVLASERRAAPRDGDGLPEYAPLFLPSGLLVEARLLELRLGTHCRELPLRAELACADLGELWRRCPRQVPWTVDLRALERVPVALLAALARLRRAQGPTPRAVTLVLGRRGPRSNSLLASLGRCFQLG